MENNLFESRQTDLDLNGPYLSFPTQPESVTGIGTNIGGTTGATVTMTGISTVSFIGFATSTDIENKGNIDYRWYEEGVGALSDSATVTGTATTTLTLSNLKTPTDNARKFFLQADYDPRNTTGIGSTGITGNAPNEPLNSGIATVTVTPLVQITTQPVSTSTFPNVAANISVVASLTDNSFSDDTQYQWQLDSFDVSNGTITKNGVDTVVAGATTPNLTLTSNNSGIGYTANCVITSATASNSPIVSDNINYTVQSVNNFSNLVIESISSNSGIASVSEVDLNNGEYTFNASTSSTNIDNIFAYSLYSPDKNLLVEMDLYGGAGASVGGQGGGQGGYSRIRFTMDKNQEYVIVGLTEAINTPFLYRRASLIACVGQGGSAGNGGNGGSGGGVNVGGAVAGDGIASGGQSINSGSLSGNGIFGSSFVAPTLYPGDQQAIDNNGGQTIRCPKGVYWAQETIASLGPCADISGSSKFRLSDGTEVSNTADLTRGYKAGYNIIQTAGQKSQPTGGNGGNGATGGSGGGFNLGGGGGSGYTDGSVTVVSTQQGGSTGNGRVVLRVVT